MDNKYLVNLRRYWKEHIVHIAVGILIGYTQSVPLAILVAVRQGVASPLKLSNDIAVEDYPEHRDTPVIDLAYFVAGGVIGLLANRILPIW